MNVLERKGAGAAFMMWAESAADLETIPTDRLPVAPKLAIAAPVADPEPVIEEEETLSPGLLAMVKMAPTEDGRLAKDKQRAANGANDIIDALLGYYPGRQFKASFDDEHFVVYCDHQVSPWKNLERHVSGFGTLVQALRVPRVAESDVRKGALKNLA